jgi:hypothetical protein
VSAVRAFYQLVEHKQFDRAERLWSPRLRQVFPPAEYIVERFARTRQLVVEQAELVALDPTRGNASVRVEVVETLDGGSRRRYRGTWDLVLARPSGSWLLNQPDLRLDR